MPHYEYECTKCGHRFEVFQRMSDAKLEVCPQCGGKIERLIGPGAGIVFKGSGFYQTDYRSDSYKKAAQSDSGAPAKSESGSSASPEKASPSPAPAKPRKTESERKTPAPAPARPKPSPEKPADK
jgi:putative FmdB family regulatory protein